LRFSKWFQGIRGKDAQKLRKLQLNPNRCTPSVSGGNM
jgi:hypothetical protein